MALSSSERRSPPLPGPADGLPAGPLDHLVAPLLAELAAAWERGEPLPAEELLAHHPEVSEHPEAAVRVIYEEVCLRQELGQDLDLEALLARFPRWRDELAVLLDCHNLLDALPGDPDFPEPGDALGDLDLRADLGRGARGRVYLAAQESLGGRPVVAKVVPREGSEHLSLARLQHTHVVPLYGVLDFPERNLRALCMPYLGGATLAQVLRRLHRLPPAQRTGKTLLDALDQVTLPGRAAGRSPVRQTLAQVSYVRAVCWVGACLADALHYAHERGLLHLDVKPSNVLLAGDGTPLLLDFHLAREPLSAGQPAPEWFGGTPDYMPPEQAAALAATRTGQPIPADVDARADVYALGLLLHEALGGQAPGVGSSRSFDDPALPATSPVPAALLPRLHLLNPQVSVGLADVVHKCLHPDPIGRYATAAALAEDLRRHLADQPLAGVSNRHLGERWRKWRRRRPRALTWVTAAAVLVLSITVASGLAGLQVRHWLTDAEEALRAGRQQVQQREYRLALDTLARGREAIRWLPFRLDLRHDLEAEQRRAARAWNARQVHELVQKLGFQLADDRASLGQADPLAKDCRTFWELRDTLLGDRQGAELGAEDEERLANDLRDLVVLWADLRARRDEAGRAAALVLLAEAKERFGPDAVLDHARRALASDGPGDWPAPESAPRTVWECYALGRALLQARRPADALPLFEQVLEEEPNHFWANFYRGACSYRLKRPADAVQAFGVCVALSPGTAACYYNRALAHEAGGETARARRDYDRALCLDPHLAGAAYNRGLLFLQQKAYRRAAEDLQHALAEGADPVGTRCALAQAQLGQNDRPAAVQALRQALTLEPDNRQARRLLDQVQGRKPRRR